MICHLRTEIVLLFSIQFGCLFFLFLASSLWLELPILCWIEVAKVGILFLFLTLEGKICVFSPLSMLLAMGCSYMAFVTLRWFSIPSLLIVFYHKRVLTFVKLFLHHLRLSCGFYLHSIHVVITLIILHLHDWDKPHSVMVCNIFNMLLNLPYWYFPLDFCMYICKRYLSVMSVCLWIQSNGGLME